MWKSACTEKKEEEREKISKATEIERAIQNAPRLMPAARDLFLLCRIVDFFLKKRDSILFSLEREMERE
jgi:hypothetical protein